LCDGIKAAAAASLVDASGRGVVETAALLKLCRVVVTVDSPARHLAAAVGTPVIVLQYGGERPQTWAAYGSHHQVVRKSVPCSPCGQVVCPHPTHDCMEAITSGEILALVCGENSRSRT
jgi:ADP-heptose:LPS heptosyltransferase